MRADDLIRAVSRDLNDQEPRYEYTHWPKEQLAEYLHEALVQLSALFKKFFVTQRVVEVQPGGGWQRACECSQVLRVLGETTRDGKQLLRMLTHAADDPDLVWGGAVHNCGWAYYELESYAVSSTDNSLFRVFPALPRGSKPRYVLVECYATPESVQDATDVPGRLVPMVKQWMMSRAYMVDSENNTTVVQLADQHLKIYNSLVQQAIAVFEREEATNGSVRAVSDRPAQ